MLTRLELDNFRSLNNFSIDFEQMTVLIGKFGTGKSTVIEALDLLSNFLRGDLNAYLEEKGVNATDLKSRENKKKAIALRLSFSIGTRSFVWKVSWELKGDCLELSEEELFDEDEELEILKFRNGVLRVLNSSDVLVAIQTQGESASCRSYLFDDYPPNISRTIPLVAKTLLKLRLLEANRSKIPVFPLKTKAEVSDRLAQVEKNLLQSMTTEQKARWDAINKQFWAWTNGIARAYEKFEALQDQATVQSTYVYLPEAKSDDKYNPQDASQFFLRRMALTYELATAPKGSMLYFNDIERVMSDDAGGMVAHLVEYVSRKEKIQFVGCLNRKSSLNKSTLRWIVALVRNKDGAVEFAKLKRSENFRVTWDPIVPTDVIIDSPLLDEAPFLFIDDVINPQYASL